MKRHEFRETLQTRVDDDMGAVVAPEEWDTWINLAVRAIWKAWPWTFATKTATLNTEDGGDKLTLPADAQHPRKVFNSTSEIHLQPSNLRVLLATYSAAAKGEPLYYADGGYSQPDDLSTPPAKVMLVKPTPDRVYALEVTYKRNAPQMTSDQHYSPLFEEFDEAVMLWCLTRFYRKLDDLAQSQEHTVLYQEELNNLIGQYGNAWQMEEYPAMTLDEA